MWAWRKDKVLHPLAGHHVHQTQRRALETLVFDAKNLDAHLGANGANILLEPVRYLRQGRLPTEARRPDGAA